MDSSLTAVPGNSVSSVVIEQLARTKGWTRFFSVILWIGSVFLVLGGIGMIFLGTMGSALGGTGMPDFGGIAGALVIGIIYIVMSLVYIYPALKLGSYSSRITELMDTPTEANLATALNEPRAFWKFVGIMMIVMLSLYLIAIPVMIVVAGAAGMSSS